MQLNQSNNSYNSASKTPVDWYYYAPVTTTSSGSQTNYPIYGYYYLPPDQAKAITGESAKEELLDGLTEIFRDITKVINTAMEEIDVLENGGWDATFIARAIRDIKADAFDAIQEVIIPDVDH